MTQRCAVPGCWIEPDADGWCAEHRDDPRYRYPTRVLVDETRHGDDWKMSRRDREQVAQLQRHRERVAEW